MQPQRFDLKYQAQGEGAQGDGYERPVMVHRAVLGSVERMIAILTEHFAGKWPFFLSPRQAQVVPVSRDRCSSLGNGRPCLPATPDPHTAPPAPCR